MSIDFSNNMTLNYIAMAKSLRFFIDPRIQALNGVFFKIVNSNVFLKLFYLACIDNYMYYALTRTCFTVNVSYTFIALSCGNDFRTGKRGLKNNAFQNVFIHL